MLSDFGQGMSLWVALGVSVLLIAFFVKSRLNYLGIPKLPARVGATMRKMIRVELTADAFALGLASLEAHGLEPKMSPFDPTAILDEIQRLVPGYDVSRMNLLAGNSQHTSLAKSGAGVAHRPESIEPANDDLFSSGTLGRYSRALKSVVESHEAQPAEVAAD